MTKEKISTTYGVCFHEGFVFFPMLYITMYAFFRSDTMNM